MLRIPGKIYIVNCETCGKEIYINENYVRPRMFCTLGCMYSDIKEAQMIS